MADDDGRAIDLFGTAPRVPSAPEPYSGAAYARLAILLAIVFAAAAVPSVLPDRLAAGLVRWLLVITTAGMLLGLFRFFRIAWQFRGDDKVPLALASLLGLYATWRLGNVLNGRDPDLYLGKGLRFRIAGTPWRWLGYPTWEATTLTMLVVALALAVIWLATSVGGYWKQKDNAGVIVITAASIALGWCVWLIVN